MKNIKQTIRKLIFPFGDPEFIGYTNYLKESLFEAVRLMVILFILIGIPVLLVRWITGW